MGANHQKEIESYCAYTLPTHGLITNCGKAHLEGFGGTEGVRKGKGELFEYLRAHNGTAFIMQDYDYLQAMSAGINTVLTYGTKDAEVCGTVTDSTELLSVAITKGSTISTINTQLVGEYNLPNVLAAVALGKYFNVPDEKIKAALEKYTPSNSRSQLIVKDGNTFILDAYNANPTSMKAAIENFAKMEGRKKVLLLGGMMELGNESIEEHRSIINIINKYTWEAVVLVGGDYSKIAHPYINLTNSTAARDWFLQQQYHNTQLLIKGSRSMQMEKVIS
jgi:UDP-N-acetylmuramoyl-tripeptide--D-alanyl-D-alanine ligase